MDLYGARKANRFPGQSLDSGTQRQVITLNTLCKNLSCQVLILRDPSGIAAPVIAGNHADGEGGQQCQQLLACLIVSRPESVSQYAACFGIVGVPEPVLYGFTADKRPLLIEFTDEGDVGVSDRRRGYPAGRELFNVRITVLMPILRVLAVSRTPEPLCAISTICFLTPGFRAS